jgi:hypothetical protein
VLSGDRGHDLARVAPSDQEVGPSVAVPLSQRIEGVQHERDSRRPGVCEHVPVEDEQRDDRPVRRRRREAAVVDPSEVSTVPVDAHTSS